MVNYGLATNDSDTGIRFKITELRIAKGIKSNRMLAEMAGVNENTIAAIDKGLRNPHTATLQKLAKALEVPTSSLYDVQSQNELANHDVAAALSGLTQTLVNGFASQVIGIVQRCTTLNEVVMVADKNGRITFSCVSLPIQTGYTQKEMFGQKPGDVLQGSVTPDNLEKMRSALIHRYPFKGKVLNFHKDGSELMCHLELIPWFENTFSFAKFVPM